MELIKPECVWLKHRSTQVELPGGYLWLAGAAGSGFSYAQWFHCIDIIPDNCNWRHLDYTSTTERARPKMTEWLFQRPPPSHRNSGVRQANRKQQQQTPAIPLGCQGQSGENPVSLLVLQAGKGEEIQAGTHGEKNCMCAVFTACLSTSWIIEELKNIGGGAPGG